MLVVGENTLLISCKNTTIWHSGGKIHISTLGAWALKMCIFLERVDIYLLHIKGSGYFSHENLKIRALEVVHPPQNIAFLYKFAYFHSLIGSPAEVLQGSKINFATINQYTSIYFGYRKEKPLSCPKNPDFLSFRKEFPWQTDVMSQLIVVSPLVDEEFSWSVKLTIS